jgi:hypothetical protein
MLAIYIGLIVGEGNDQIAAQGDALSEMFPWAVAMAAAASAAVVANFIENERIARSLLFASALLFAVLGAVSILSIGIGFLVTAGLAGEARRRLHAEATR